MSRKLVLTATTVMLPLLLAAAPALAWGPAKPPAPAPAPASAKPDFTTDPDKPFIPVGQSVIVAEAHFTFQSPAAKYLPATSDLHDTAYLMPRSITVACATC